MSQFLYEKRLKLSLLFKTLKPKTKRLYRCFIWAVVRVWCNDFKEFQDCVMKNEKFLLFFEYLTAFSMTKLRIHIWRSRIENPNSVKEWNFGFEEKKVLVIFNRMMLDLQYRTNLSFTPWRTLLRRFIATFVDASNLSFLEDGVAWSRRSKIWEYYTEVKRSLY